MVCVKPMVRALLRCSLALGLVLGGVALTAADAQAQNWGVGMPAAKKTQAEIEDEAEKAYQADADKRAAKEAQREKDEAEAKEAEKATAGAEPEPEPATAAAPTPPKGKARRAFVETAVPGCPPGQLCTVCVAGCGTRSTAIVHASRNPARKE